MVGREHVQALVMVALGLGLGCAADPPASGDNDGSPQGGTGSNNLPTTGGGAGTSNKPPTTTAGSIAMGAAGMAGGMTMGQAGGAGTTPGMTAGAAGGAMSGGMVNCSALALPSNADDVISTFEDGLGNVNQTAGRGGGFYMFNDMTGMQMPPPGGLPPAQKTPRCDSMFALCMAGKGFKTWGAGMGTDLGMTAGGGDGGTAMKNSYDASMYKGIQFWAKANPGSAVAVRVNFKDVNTAPEGGVCNKAETSGPESCNDDWGKPLNLTTTWAPYTILWSELRQAGWGKASTAFDSKKAYSIQFQVSQNLDFDLCIDDLAFVR